MTIAFEPRLVFPGLGADGIENTVFVAEGGLKHLTFSDQKLAILWVTMLRFAANPC